MTSLATALPFPPKELLLATWEARAPEGPHAGRTWPSVQARPGAQAVRSGKGEPGWLEVQWT